MNDKFYQLPIEKQQKIINAGYRVFSQNNYKNSPMSEIADEAGISKSLLFHYFLNKKELYMFLWNKCSQITIEYLTKYDCYNQSDIFKAMELGTMAKIEIMREYPDMSNFAVKAFYEKEPDISIEIQKSYKDLKKANANPALTKMDYSLLRDGVDLEMMLKDMYLASEGYLWEAYRNNNVDVNQIEKDFKKLLAFWKKIYLKEELL